jgi:nanoRNase/pAp phosphatase (c-di-AMP/oligoRNAs hydrolase)
LKQLAQKLKRLIKKHKNLLILIKGSPDPDAIASSYALKELCDYLKVDSAIFAPSVISLPQNREFVDIFNIPIKFESSLKQIKGYDGYAVLDHQSVEVEEFTNRIPCSIHIDHHELVEENVPVKFKLVDKKAGSTSTLIALLMHEMNIELDIETKKNISTALMFGIETDTNKYSYTSKRDYEALALLAGFADSRIINRLSRFPITAKAAGLIASAKENRFLYKDWLISGVGFLDESDRDLIAIIADYMLEREDVSTIVIFAAIEKKNKSLVLDASFRTNNENINLNSLIKSITTNGGGRKFKGAFQINLNYFLNCPDKDLLWEVIKQTTVETLSKKRDKLYISELKGFFGKLKEKMINIFED